MLDDDLPLCDACGEPFVADIEEQELCAICEAALHEHYQGTQH